MGTSGETNIYSGVLNSLNSIISFSAYNTLDLASVSSLTVTGQSSINISSSNINLSGTVNMCNNNINNAGIITSSNIFAGTATIGTPTYFGNNFAFFGNNTLPSSGSEYALLHEFNGTTFLNCSSGRLLRFRQNNIDIFTADSGGIYMNAGMNMNGNNITFGTSGGDIYKINTAFWANGGTAQGYGGSLYLGASNSVYFQVPVGFQNSGTPLDMNNNNITNLSSITSAVTTMTLSNTTNIDINAPTINVGGAVNANCNAISNIGDMSRYMISTEIQQPVIQYAYVSTTGALSGAVTITLPQRYTSVSSYIPFAVVQNDATTTFYVSTITRATFEIGWDGFLGVGDIIFSWNTLGT
jgi:hypothetical protein